MVPYSQMIITLFVIHEISLSNTLIYENVNQSEIRKKFLVGRKNNLITKKRINILDKYLDHDVEEFERILHYKVDRHKQINKINKIENEFQNIINMKGMKTVFKRDAHWRTWRNITKSNGDQQIICYKCNNLLTKNCSTCYSGGFWIIEENEPPCPFEIFSVQENNKLCASDIFKLGKNSTIDTKDCPVIINIIDVTSSCDNPIVTKWIITKDYRSSEGFPVVICNGREYCEFSTIYVITPQNISFKIINGNNEIIYSRIMKNGGNNYVCIDDCGTFDPSTRKVIKQEKPYSYNFLPKRVPKNKRENEPFASMFEVFNRNIFNVENDSGFHGQMQIPKSTKETKSRCKEIVDKNLIYLDNKKK